MDWQGETHEHRVLEEQLGESVKSQDVVNA